MKKILILTLFLVISWCSLAFAASPVIFYSDLTSGPNTGGQDNKGVFVTIAGKNFGATRGTSYVSIGGGQADNYPLWSDTKIAFQLGANAATGDITITTSGGTSNGLAFTVRAGNIYFVDNTNGNDNNDGSYATPWKTLSKTGGDRGSNLSAGSTYYFRSGTWSEQISLGGNSPSGTANNEIALIAYPGEIARWEGTYNFDWGYQRNYYVVAGFQFYATTHNTQIRGLHNRFINNDCEGIKTAYSYAMINPMECNYAKIYGNTLYGATSGNKLDHPLYIGYGADNVDFGWNHIHDNDVAEGPAISINQDGAATNQAYQFDGILIHDNLIDCRNSSVGLRAIGFIAQYAGSNAKVYNNIIINGGGYVSNPFTIYQISGSVDYYNNTLYNSDGSYAISIDSDSDSGNYTETVNIKNNIIYTQSGTAYIVVGDGDIATLSNNCYYGNGNGPSEDTRAVNADPKFISSSDYHLQATSPAKDAGADIGASVTRDYDGTLRPQGTGVDMGAYEYAEDSIPPAAVTDLGANSITSTTVVLGWTAPGNDGNAGRAASYDLRYSTTSITDSNWASATQLTGEPSPSSAGTVEIFTVSGLTTGIIYYFALKTTDYAGNTSAISNIVQATTSSPYSGDGGGGGGGGGCCIATASFGTPLAEEVKYLCKFRDMYLLTNGLGRNIVRMYWKISPKIAHYIEKRMWARRVARGILQPLVWIAKLCVNK